MPTQPNEATINDMITCDRLMMWAHLCIAPKGNLTPYQKCILSELAGEFTAEEFFCESLDQRDIFYKRISKLGPLRGLLPGIFWAETARSLWGRVILQHLGLELLINDDKARPSSIPAFMLPLNCVCCNHPLENINSDNYDTLPKWKCSEDDHRGYGKCKRDWATMKVTFEKAINALIELGTIPFEQRNIDPSLPVILAAYHQMSRHLNEYDLGRRPYIPRYSLIKEYGSDYSWFVPYLIYDGNIITEETHQPMFKKELIGKTIWAIEDKEGKPYNCDIKGEVITISQLKDFLIKKPQRSA